MSCHRRFAIALWGLCSIFYAGTLPAQSLVHRWSFETNFSDTSGSGNDGTATGAPTFVAGRFGQAVSIVSPSDGVHLDFGAQNLPLQGTAAWSTNVWAKLNVAPADLEYVAGFSLNDLYQTGLDVGKGRAYISFGGASSNNFYFWGGASDVNSGVGYSVDNQWHMYTITYDGTALQMYKDASPIFATPVTVGLTDAFDEVHVGNPSNWNSNFDGSVDEFTIFDAALSQSQIGGLYSTNDFNQPVILDPSITVDRVTGEIVLTNNSSFPIDVLGYTIHSASGSLNPTVWDTIAGRYDSPPGGDGSIDANDDWTVLTNTNLSYSVQLSEGVPGTDGATIAIGKVVNFGPSWVANPHEDLSIDLLLNDGQGTIRTVPVTFTGNGDLAYGIGDLDTDGDVDAADWNLFRTSTSHDFAGKTVAEAYLSGDLDGDFDKDLNDFNLFVQSFDAGAGSGAFERMLASVPEPSGLVLLCMAATVLGATRVARINRRGLGLLGALAVSLCFTGEASAALWGYYPLNGNANEATGNNINLNLVGDATFAGSVHPGLGSAGSFDGNGDGMIGGDFNKFQTNSVTVMAWAYAESLAGDWNTIIKNWGTSDGGQFHLGLGSQADDTLQNFIAGGANVTTTTAFPANAWVHTAFVLDAVANEHRLYMNGQIVATGAYTGTLGQGGAAITGLGIGYKPNDDGTALSTNGPGPWNGRIDDVGLFDTAMTTVQIQQIYQDGLNGIQLDGTTTPYVALQVDRSNGVATLRNTTAGAVSISAYEISSVGGSLVSANWQDLAGNAGFPTGNGSGNGWEKDLASDSHQLLETYLTGNSNFNTATDISLGNIFGGGSEDLTFRYRTSSGTVIDSIVQYIGTAPGLIGDYNANGVVDAADYVVWRKNLNANTALPNEDLTVTPGQVTAADYGVWRSRFGNTSGSGVSIGTAVPEPAASCLLALAALSLVGMGRFSKRFE